MKTSSTTYHMGSEMECSITCGGQFTLIVCGVSNHLGGKVGGRGVGREGVREGGGARRNMKREFDPGFMKVPIHTHTGCFNTSDVAIL